MLKLGYTFTALNARNAARARRTQHPSIPSLSRSMANYNSRNARPEDPNRRYEESSITKQFRLMRKNSNLWKYFVGLLAVGYTVKTVLWYIIQERVVSDIKRTKYQNQQAYGEQTLCRGVDGVLCDHDLLFDRQVRCCDDWHRLREIYSQGSTHSP